ncbi:MAG TPA: NINE protein [Nostoc sp.]|uniref:NINE protein n=1 Tax=Nostoc sp. TaxID=1180 RepID=UPI002D4D2158|nr:NINE protein [Nostoc sp.]HYX15671.1 NINE protein [Nostoc sp.]
MLGTLGIHKFILGYTKEGIIMLFITLFTAGYGAFIIAIISIIEGIIYLTKRIENSYKPMSTVKMVGSE